MAESSAEAGSDGSGSDAGGGAEYVYTDSLRLPPQLRRARGLEIVYELYTVSLNGKTEKAACRKIALR